MRPYTENIKTPKDGGKRQHTRRGQAKDMVGGVKKSIVKAKVTAVKAGRRKLNKAEKDEVDDLLEISRNEATTNGNASLETPKLKVAATSSKVAVAKLNKKMEKLKSVVSMASIRNGQFEQMETTPTRRSSRISQKAGIAANGDHANGSVNGNSTNGTDGLKPDISVAEEVTEANSNSSNGAGFLKKTISKIWKLPQDISSGLSYQEINTGNSPAKTNDSGVKIEEIDAPSKSTCIIS